MKKLKTAMDVHADNELPAVETEYLTSITSQTRVPCSGYASASPGCWKSQPSGPASTTSLASPSSRSRGTWRCSERLPEKVKVTHIVTNEVELDLSRLRFGVLAGKHVVGLFTSKHEAEKFAAVHPTVRSVFEFRHD